MKKKKESLTINRHFIFIEAPIEKVSPEVVLWGDAPWWPKASPMQFTRIRGEKIDIGTQYELKVKKPFGSRWQAEMEELIPDKLVKRTFSKGMVAGYEVIKMSERSNGTRVDYEMHYTIRGFMNKALWNWVYRKQHDDNLKSILQALKQYVLKEQERIEER